MALHIDYYVSLNSPWTHLGAARIEAMAMAHDATLRVFPVDFGAIFAKSGGLPLPQRSPQRQAYRLQELRRWRDHLGIPIAIEPKFFPASEQLSAPCVIAVRETIGDQPAIKLVHRVLKALWQEEKNPADPATLAELIKDVGLDAGPGDEAGRPNHSGRSGGWRIPRRRWIAACSVPPAMSSATTSIWGQDRLEFVERRLAHG